MTEEVQMAKDEAKEKMEGAVVHLETELQKVRAGKASPMMLSGVQVDYYGAMTPLSQVANINTGDARTLLVQPWEKPMLEPIATAIINANLGLNPQSNGESIIINVPPLTEERRRDLTKRVKAEGEHAKVSIRNARKDANDLIKMAKSEGLSEDLAKDAEASIQDMTNEFARKVESIVSAKEDSIMTV